MAEPLQIRVRVTEGTGRGPGGRFAKGFSNEYRNQMREKNREMARAQQAEVVDQVKAGIKRRAVTTGRLVSVTGDPQNVESSDSHWGVGVESFLDRSIAKYWRQIEEGYEGHVGREIYGFWGASFRRVNGDRVYGGPPYSRHSGTRNQDMFIPATGFREEGRFARYEGEGGRNGAPNFARKTTIKNPIVAHWDYRDAKRNFDPGRRSLQAVRDVLVGLSEDAWRASAARRGYFY